MNTSELSEIEYDNDLVSRPSPQFYRGFGIFMAILVTINFVVALFVINPIFDSHDLIRDLLVISLLNILVVLYLVGLFMYMGIFPKTIYFGKDGIILIKNNKRINVHYRDLDNFSFSDHSFDKEGKPCPRWVIRWNKGFIKRLINLTEENARRLAKRLDELRIYHTWDEHRRAAWEKRIKKLGYDSISK